MRPLRAIFILAAVAYVVGQVVHERKRLLVVERLPPEEARDYHERGRVRAERTLVVMTAVSVAAGIAAAVYLWGGAA